MPKIGEKTENRMDSRGREIKKKVPLMKKISGEELMRWVQPMHEQMYCENPECRKPWVMKKWVSKETGREFLYPSPGCDCYENKMAEERKQEEEKKEQEYLMKRFEEGRIPKRCRINYYPIPSKTIEVREPVPGGKPGETRIKILLEYEKFKDVVAKPWFYIRNYPGLFIPGSPGTRKTGYIGEFAKECIRQGRNVVYYQVGEILQKKIDIEYLIGVDILILDDLGNSTWEGGGGGLIWTLLNRRIDEGKFTVVITNFSESHNIKIFNPAFMDRLNPFYPIAMIGPSSRKLDGEIEVEEEEEKTR